MAILDSLKFPLSSIRRSQNTMKNENELVDMFKKRNLVIALTG